MNINDVFSPLEAAQLWGVSKDTVKKACSGQKGFPPRFNADEYRKSGNAWIVTRAGMNRLFGKKDPQK